MHYMHLYNKWLKYAFAYAHMQMHNYPKPTYNDYGRTRFKYYISNTYIECTQYK